MGCVDVLRRIKKKNASWWEIKVKLFCQLMSAAAAASFPGSAKRQQFQVSRKINFQAFGFNPLKFRSVNCEAALLRIVNSVRREDLGGQTSWRSPPMEQTPPAQAGIRQEV